MKKKILFVLVFMVMASSLSAARVRKYVRGTEKHPIRVSHLEMFLDGPYPGPPPDVSGCTQKTAPAGTWAYAYSARKGWGYGPLKYDQPVWATSTGKIRKWETCGNPGRGCIPCPKEPPCIKTTQRTEETEEKCNPTVYGGAEGSPTMRMNANSQYSPTTPRESVDNGGFEIPFGVFGYKPNQTTITQSPIEDCHLTPEEAAKIVKPTFGQVTDGVVLY